MGTAGICMRLAVVSPSDDKFRAQLSNSRGLRADDLAERAGRALIGDIAVNRLRSKKLRMVESVERFGPKLKRFRFREAHVFENSEIIIVHSWCGKDLRLAVPGVRPFAKRFCRGVSFYA